MLLSGTDMFLLGSALFLLGNELGEEQAAMVLVELPSLASRSYTESLRR